MQSWPASWFPSTGVPSENGAALENTLDGATTTAPAPSAPASALLAPHEPFGYPALIQFWRIVTSDAGGRLPGGIGDDAFFIRDSESCASFWLGISCEGAIRSAYVTSPARAPVIGGSEWHPPQFAANIVATSQGTPDAAAAPPSPDAAWPPPGLPDPPDDELPEPPDDGLTPDVLPEELPPAEDGPDGVGVGDAPGT